MDLKWFDVWHSDPTGACCNSSGWACNPPTGGLSLLPPPPSSTSSGTCCMLPSASRCRLACTAAAKCCRMHCYSASVDQSAQN